MRSSVLRSTLVALGLAAAVQGAFAVDTFNISGTGSTGVSFSGTVTYDLAAAHELTIALNNTTPSVGGFLTGLAFNLAGATVEAFTSSHPAMLLGSNLNTAPFGSREWGVAVGANWLGGGNPSGGVAAGTGGTWSFDLTGGPAHLTFNDLSLLARFRGLDNDGSDKVIAVPEPQTWALLLAGIGVVGFAARRRRAA